jgi:hypothetical protein
MGEPFESEPGHAAAMMIVDMNSMNREETTTKNSNE